VGRVDISSLEVIEPLQILVEPSQVISSTILPKDSGNTYIQVGAYSKIGSASRVMTAVSHLGDIGMESIQLNGRKIYRVRIGPLKSSDFASSTLAKILKLGHSMANVVID
jgi:rare lipoprotein A